MHMSEEREINVDNHEMMGRIAVTSRAITADIAHPRYADDI